VSWIDDQSAEIEAQLDAAWQKCGYGKTYSRAYEVAERIKFIRFLLSEKEEKDVDPNLNCVEANYILQTAGILLIAAITTSKKLREIADAIDAEKRLDPRQANILEAYTDCIEGRYPPTIVETSECSVTCYLPTLAQLREAFVKRFGQECWPKDFAVRKTLKVLGLQLSEGKRGRPSGSRSIIHNRKH
jgi:hypothetical protein